MSIVVASVPANHVYVRHLSSPTRPDAVVRLADPPAGPSPDSPWWPPVMLDATWVEQHADEFDLMHVNFGFDAIGPEALQDLVAALHHHDKPLVVTVHDLRNPHHDTAELHDAQLGVLVRAADAVLTLTPGAAASVRKRWGRDATVLPHPHVVPDEWLRRARPRRDEFVVGLHAKSLRANMEPLSLVAALAAVLPTMPGTRLRVDAHTDVMTQGYDRHDEELASELTRLADAGLVDLRVHDFFSDDELFGYLHGLDVSVLPYRFGTHSGWLEACHDLGTWVVAPDCGFYAEQRPVLSYAASGPDRTSSLLTAVRTAYDAWCAGEVAPRASAVTRRTEREHLSLAHERLYGALLERRLACTS